MFIKRSKRSKEELEEAFQRVQASLAIEGLVLTDEEKELVMANARGDISDREFKKLVYKKVTGKEWEG